MRGADGICLHGPCGQHCNLYIHLQGIPECAAGRPGQNLSLIHILDENGDYESVPAVIDKDFASARLAELVDADYLFILTAVDRVAVNYGKPDQRELREITVQEAERLCSQGHFAPGSMLPKVEAAMEFARGKKGRKSVIASLEKAPLAMIGESGTRIVLG